MAEYTNFDKVGFLRGWSYRILPLVYDDSLSYYELLAKMTKLLNQLIENNNKLPEFLRELVREFLSGGEFAELLREILSTYILNVKYPPEGITPAAGDGSKEDTEAFQGCIDYAFNQGGGAVYVPYGDYLVGRITVKPGVALFGFDRNSTRLVAKGGIRNDMITILENSSLHNLTLDVNQDMQVNNVRGVSCTGPSNTTLTNLLIKDAYDGIFYYQTSTGRNILTDILIDGVTRYGVQFDGTATFACDNISVSGLNFNTAFFITVSNSTFSGMQTTGTGYRGLSLSGNNNTFSGTISGCNFPHSIPGGNNTVDLAGVLESTQANSIEKRANYVTFNVLNNTRFETGSFEVYSPNGTVSLQSGYLSLNPSNPLRYSKEPQRLNARFNYVPFSKPNGTEYKVLVEGENTTGEYSRANVRDYGAKGDGSTNDTAAFQAAESSDARTIYVPPGVYRINRIISRKNWVCEDGATLVPAADEYMAVLTLTGSGKVHEGLFVDGLGYETRNLIRVEGSYNHFKTVKMKNVTFRGVNINGGLNVLGNYNTFDFVCGENFVWADDVHESANHSMPQMITLQNPGNGNYFGDIYAKNCRSVIVDATTHNSTNNIGNISGYQIKDNLVYVIRGSLVNVDNAFVWDGEEGLVAITDPGFDNTTDSAIICNNLTAGNLSRYVVRPEKMRLVQINNINLIGDVDALLFAQQGTGYSGDLYIGSITGEGHIRRLAFLEPERIIYNHLFIGEMNLRLKWKSSFGLGNRVLFSAAAKSFKINDVNLTVLMTEGEYNPGSRMYFNLDPASIEAPSHLGHFSFNFLNVNGTINDNIILSVARPTSQQNAPLLTLTGGYVAPATGSTEFTSFSNTYDNLVSSGPPQAGYWQQGTMLTNTFGGVDKTIYGWVCTASGTPGTWATLHVSPKRGDVQCFGGPIRWYDGTQWVEIS